MVICKNRRPVGWGTFASRQLRLAVGGGPGCDFFALGMQTEEIITEWKYMFARVRFDHEALKELAKTGALAAAHGSIRQIGLGPG